jgi:hypothetical protein
MRLLSPSQLPDDASITDTLAAILLLVMVIVDLTAIGAFRSFAAAVELDHEGVAGRSLCSNTFL